MANWAGRPKDGVQTALQQRMKSLCDSKRRTHRVDVFVMYSYSIVNIQIPFVLLLSGPPAALPVLLIVSIDIALLRPTYLLSYWEVSRFMLVRIGRI